MDFLLPVAAKSLLIAGATLLLLKAMQRRSAADRSFVAHLGLAAIAVLPLALLALPQLEVPTSLLGSEPAPVQATAPLATVTPQEVTPSAATFPAPAEPSFLASIDWGFWAYAAPAGLLVLLTLIALLRLVLLKSKANVLVEPHWLTALAHAQRRMGFKHGTALLTSNELRSPISWGLMRPVILLNSEAAEAHGEAEAIIAHELAHVARLDWLKLLLSRITVALFWFNPLVWLLAREAHQLREEAADDAVLGANIEDTEYAKLLVGIARHECRGLLIGAHGVAPARNSLARRVQRVLDVASSRAPGGWRWSAAAAFFAAGMAVPLATLHFVPMTPAAAHVETVGGKARTLARATTPAAPSPKTTMVADGVNAPIAPAPVSEVLASSPTIASAATVAHAGKVVARATAPNGATVTTMEDGTTVARSPSGATVTTYPADRHGRRRVVAVGTNGAVAESYAHAGARAATAKSRSAFDRAIELKAVGATPEYSRAILSAAPHLRLSHDDVVELAAVGVSPAYVRDLASSGYPRLGADEIVEAKAMGITGSYIRGMAAAGYGHLSMDKLVELKAVGATPEDVARFKRAGRGLPSVDRLVALKAMSIDPSEINSDDP